MSGQKHTPIAYFDVAELKDGKLNSDVFVFRQPDIELFAAYHEDDYNAIRAQRDELLAALKNLYALVRGECPSLIEDDHHDEMVSNAIANAERQS